MEVAGIEPSGSDVKPGPEPSYHPLYQTKATPPASKQTR